MTKRSLAAPGMTMVASLLRQSAWAAQSTAVPESVLLDDFESISDWSALPSEGVALTARTARGRTEQAMRLDFDFQGRGGYAIARRALNLDPPENYEFSFWIRGDARPNTLEFKLADQSGDNVWWYTRPRWKFPREWTKVTIKRRHIRFAWGPAGGGDLRRAAALELVITAGSGRRRDGLDR